MGNRRIDAKVTSRSLKSQEREVDFHSLWVGTTGESDGSHITHPKVSCYLQLVRYMQWDYIVNDFTNSAASHTTPFTCSWDAVPSLLLFQGSSSAPQFCSMVRNRWLSAGSGMGSEMDLIDTVGKESSPGEGRRCHGRFALKPFVWGLQTLPNFPGILCDRWENGEEIFCSLVPKILLPQRHLWDGEQLGGQVLESCLSWQVPPSSVIIAAWSPAGRGSP